MGNFFSPQKKRSFSRDFSRRPAFGHGRLGQSQSLEYLFPPILWHNWNIYAKKKYFFGVNFTFLLLRFSRVPLSSQHITFHTQRGHLLSIRTLRAPILVAPKQHKYLESLKQIKVTNLESSSFKLVFNEEKNKV